MDDDDCDLFCDDDDYDDSDDDDDDDAQVVRILHGAVDRDRCPLDSAQHRCP